MLKYFSLHARAYYDSTFPFIMNIYPFIYFHRYQSTIIILKYMSSVKEILMALGRWRDGSNWKHHNPSSIYDVPWPILGLYPANKRRRYL